jgi:hypothetical protein
MQDYSLREHPASTMRRLKASGDWPEAGRLLRRIKQQCRRRLVKSGEVVESYLEFVKAVEHQLEVSKKGWDAVHDRWPPPPGTRPQASLAAYLRSERGPGRDRVDTTLPVLFRTPLLSREAWQRFEEIGDTETLLDEVIWVYDHLDDANVDPLECPNLAAWVLLGMSRNDPLRFHAWIDRVLTYHESQGAEVATGRSREEQSWAENEHVTCYNSHVG